MQIHTTARHCELDPEVRLIAQTRIEKLGRYARDLQEAHLIVTGEGYRYTAEITLRLKGRELVSREEADEAALAIDLAAGPAGATAAAAQGVAGRSQAWTHRQWSSPRGFRDDRFRAERGADGFRRGRSGVPGRRGGLSPACRPSASRGCSKTSSRNSSSSRSPSRSHLAARSPSATSIGPGMALMGFVENFLPERIQILAQTELTYLATLKRGRGARRDRPAVPVRRCR